MGINIVIVLVVLLFLMITDKFLKALKDSELTKKRLIWAWGLYAISVVGLICISLMYA